MDIKHEEIVRLIMKTGQAVMEIYEMEDFATTLKDDESPLTRADIAAHHTILKGLKELTPDIPVLSEESEAVLYEKRRLWSIYWLVDPLDGTKEFLKRNGEFTVNIALIENGLPVLGVVHAPALGVTYYAERGKGAFKQAQGEAPVLIRVSDYRKGRLKIVISRSHRNDRLEKFLKKIPDYESVSMGSSLKFCLVAEGTAHLYPRLGPTMEWDTAASQCVVEEAGGSVTDFSGNRLRYNKPDLLNPAFIVCGNPPYPWQQLL